MARLRREEGMATGETPMAAGPEELEEFVREDTYIQWRDAQGVPVVHDFYFPDLKTMELSTGPWMGGRGAIINIPNTLVRNDCHVVEDTSHIVAILRRIFEENRGAGKAVSGALGKSLMDRLKPPEEGASKEKPSGEAVSARHMQSLLSDLEKMGAWMLDQIKPPEAQIDQAEVDQSKSESQEGGQPQSR